MIFKIALYELIERVAIGSQGRFIQFQNPQNSSIRPAMSKVELPSPESYNEDYFENDAQGDEKKKESANARKDNKKDRLKDRKERRK